MGILSSLGRLSSFGGSCFRACTARVTVVVRGCVSVNKYHLGASVRPENAVTYSVGDKGRAAGGGPVGQAMAGTLLTIIVVKYCDSTS